MAQNLNATIADVLVSFQTAPGVDTATIINAGNATLLDAVSPRVIKPQSNGFFGFKMEENGSVEFQVLGTMYLIQHHKTPAIETQHTGKQVVISCWKGLGNITDLHGVQRRLQLLGYYPGLVDDKNGPMTERAILNFQADNGLRTDGIAIGGTAGAISTRNKLNDIIENKNKTGSIYISRLCLVRFMRAPSLDPQIHSGRPWGKAPDPDDRGFKEADCLGTRRKNPLVTIMSSSEFRLKLVREKIGTEADIIASSTAESAVENLEKKSLPHLRENVLQFKSGQPLDADIKFHVNAPNKVVISSLHVTVLSKKLLKVQPYWVTIGGKTPQGKMTDWKEIFDIVNNIWWPYGIQFNFLKFREKKIVLSFPGRISTNGGALKTEFDSAINALDISNNPPPKNAVNLLIVDSIENCVGVSYCTMLFSWPNGIALSLNPRGIAAAGNDLAHELGHSLSLANIDSPTHLPYHSDDDPDDTHKKEDIWTLRKLMHSYNSFSPTRPSDTWVQDVGYGNTLRGSMVTVRHLSGDNTDNECAKARKWAATEKKVYFKR